MKYIVVVVTLLTNVVSIRLRNSTIGLSNRAINSTSEDAGVVWLFWPKMEPYLKEKDAYNPDAPLVLRMLAAAAPRPKRCQCEMEFWDQYYVCKDAFRGSKRALSFGILGYDTWGKHLQQSHQIVPELYDCFNGNQPKGFDNNFYSICLGGKHEVDSRGRVFETLPFLLSKDPPASVLLKVDVEGSEWDSFEVLENADFAKIESLSVEYHLSSMYHGKMGECASKETLEKFYKVMAKMKQHFEVLDERAAWKEDCSVDGVAVPNLIIVSYTRPELCSASK